MSCLSFTATGQTLKRTDGNQLAQNAVGLVAAFTLSSEWDGRQVVARFGAYDVLLSSESCIIPWEVMRNTCFYVQLIGTKSADDVITTNQIYVETVHSDSTPGESPTEPTETLYQQIADSVLALNARVDALEPMTSRTLFAQTVPVTVTGTSETAQIGAGVGSMTIPANSLIVGQTYRLHMVAFLTGANGVATTLRIKLDNNAIVNSAGTIPTNLTASPVVIDFVFACRSTGATGTISGGGTSLLAGGQGVSTSYVRGLSLATPVTIDTAQSHTISVTYQFGTTGQTLLATNATLERLF